MNRGIHGGEVTADKLRLLLVEDHVLVRQSIRAFLQDANFIVVGEAGTGAEAVQMAHALRPQLILLDIHLPEMNGIEAARQIRSQHPEIRIIALTAYNEKIYQRALAAVGVHNFILKTAEFSELLRCINKVMQTPVERRISTQAVTINETDYRLTERETEVLHGAAQGWTNKQIGLRLDISARTVQVHLYTIYQKLSVANRTEAVLRALALNMIPPIEGAAE